jgi:SNF2 family DNA or RNA helicase
MRLPWLRRPVVVQPPDRRAVSAIEVQPAGQLEPGQMGTPSVVTVIDLIAGEIRDHPPEPRTEAGDPSSAGAADGEGRPQALGPSLADRLRQVMAVPLEALLPGPNTVLDWPAPLLDYQLTGVRALVERQRLLLADDMGLGKTVQAIAALRVLCHAGSVQSALLVVPASLLDQWRRELRRWAPELRVVVVRGSATDRAWQWKGPAHLKIVSYETLRADNESSAGWARHQQWGVVILDEAQKIKNAESATAHVCKLLDRRRSWAMTGTPLENKLEDLASILEFVDRDPGGEPPRYRPGPALLARHQELQLRRRKADVLAELPPKQVLRVSLPLLADQRMAYDRAEREGVMQLKAKGAEVRIQHVLELILRLKQLCNFNPASGSSAKAQDICERLEVLVEEGHRALVFSQFTDETFGVRALARDLVSFEPLVFTGDLSGPERDRIVRRFKTESWHRALVLSLRAGGVGINLQEASYVFHLDRWWNPAVERQAEDRSHRMGQQHPVTVFTYTCVDTIEQRIDEIISGKQALFDEIVDDVSIDLGAKLSADELFGLFDLDRAG